MQSFNSTPSRLRDIPPSWTGGYRVDANKENSQIILDIPNERNELVMGARYAREIPKLYPIVGFHKAMLGIALPPAVPLDLPTRDAKRVPPQRTVSLAKKIQQKPSQDIPRGDGGTTHNVASLFIDVCSWLPGPEPQYEWGRLDEEINEDIDKRTKQELFTRTLSTIKLADVMKKVLCGEDLKLPVHIEHINKHEIWKRTTEYVCLAPENKKLRRTCSMVELSTVELSDVDSQSVKTINRNDVISDLGMPVFKYYKHKAKYHECNQRYIRSREQTICISPRIGLRKLSSNFFPLGGSFDHWMSMLLLEIKNCPQCLDEYAGISVEPIPETGRLGTNPLEQNP
ncbi:hypothetical protein [Parendozoicomonas sp. Alg238-R29]|uniref:hypothetical protein n=1 Tax=Parendozoicomonas sp. Alg238-R29 TaxID=2993446 RepID=UPI00248D6D7A|nr:hypothetical protein [Parendozoicomonas sp. Alg238-R29]